MAAAQECCREVAPSDNPGIKDIRALGGIMMELMQKHAKDNGRIGIENLDRWPSDSAGFEFISATTFASSAKELINVNVHSFSTVIILTSLATLASMRLAKGLA